MPYPYSYQSHTATASVGPFSYSNVSLLSDVPVKDQIKVYLNGQIKTLTTDYTLTANETITFNSAVTGTVKIARESDIENKEVTFTNSSVLTAQDLNKNSDQLLFLAQELYDKTQDIAVASISSIPDNAVTEAKLNKTLGVEAVTTNTIRTGAVTTPKLSNGAVTEEKIGGNAVTQSKIMDGQVTSGKLAPDAVTTVKILNANVTPAKLSTGAPTWGPTGDVAVNNNLTVTNNAIVNGNLQFNSGFGASTVAYGCRAWATFNVATLAGAFNRPNGSTTVTITSAGHGFAVNDEVFLDFNVTIADAPFVITGVTTDTFTVTTAGQTAAATGTVTIYYVQLQASGNIGRMGLTATTVAGGVYTVTFGTAMTDANYAVMFGAQANSATTASGTGVQVKNGSQTAFGFTIEAFSSGTTAANPARVYFGVFR